MSIHFITYTYKYFSDFLLTTYIIEYCNDKNPDEITDIRSSIVNNNVFAALSIRIGLHRFFLYRSEKLNKIIGLFYDHQHRIDFKINQEVRIFLLLQAI